MATTIGQAKAIIRRKFDHAEKMANATCSRYKSMRQCSSNIAMLSEQKEAYHYWLGQRAVLAELLTSIDET